MSIKWKIFLILVAVYGVFVSLIYVVYALFVSPFIDDLERVGAKKDIDRCIGAIDNELSHLGFICSDWANWDDTWMYMQGKMPEYVDTNFMLDTFYGAQVNFMCLIRKDGMVAFGKIYDVTVNPSVELMNLTDSKWGFDSELLCTDEKDEGKYGIIETEFGTMLVASKPILTSIKEGPCQGTFIMGRLLGREMTEKLSSQISVSFDVYSLESQLKSESFLTQNEREKISKLKAREALYTVPVSDDRLMVYSTYSGFDETPKLLIAAEIGREIRQSGMRVLRFLFISVIFAGLVFLILVLLLLQFAVTRPLYRLKQHMVAVGISGDLSVRMPLKTGDEFETLASEFDQLLERLQAVRQQLMEQSYFSGMADLASGVMHSVRNALTPILHYIFNMRTELEAIPADNIKAAIKAMDTLQDSKARSEYEKYLCLSAIENLELVEEFKLTLENLNEQIITIENLLIEHERHGRTRSSSAKVKIAEIIRQAIAATPPELLRGISLEIIDETEGELELPVHRISMQHVIANLISNAAESIKRAEKSAGKIVVKAAFQTTSPQRIEISVSDNGMGLRPDELAAVFERGYTTKPDSFSGFGLHWCANTIGSFGGSIFAKSDGIGKGAVFVVQLPLNRRQD